MKETIYFPHTALSRPMHFAYTAVTDLMELLNLAPMALPLEEQVRARIKAWVTSMGVSQTVLAERIGRDQVWVSRYLNGKVESIDLATLQKIATAFDHTLHALLEAPADPREAQLVEDYRALRLKSRAIVSALVADMRRDRLNNRR